MTNPVARVKNLLLSPSAEWDVIAQEAIRPRALILGYVIPLSALPAAATVFGLSVLGVDVAGETVRAPWMWMAFSTALFFVMSVVGVLVFAWLLNALAPAFGAARDYSQALKVSGYSITAAMVAGIATVVPALGIVALIGASYSLYLLFLGAPRVMKPAPNSATNYSIVATACALGLGLAVGLAAMTTFGPSTRVLFPRLARLPALVGAPPVTTSAPTPPPAPVVAALPVRSPSGLVSIDALKALAPDRLAGLDRVSLGVEASGPNDARAVSLDAEYRKGRRFIDLEIVHSPAISTILGFGGAATSEYDSTTADGYSRRRREGGAIVVEEWNNASEAGSYGRLTDDQFYVKASGGYVTPKLLKQAVESFSPDRLARLERAP